MNKELLFTRTACHFHHLQSIRCAGPALPKYTFCYRRQYLLVSLCLWLCYHHEATKRFNLFETCSLPLVFTVHVQRHWISAVRRHEEESLKKIAKSISSQIAWHYHNLFRRWFQPKRRRQSTKYVYSELDVPPRVRDAVTSHQSSQESGCDVLRNSSRATVNVLTLHIISILAAEQLIAEVELNSLLRQQGSDKVQVKCVLVIMGICSYKMMGCHYQRQGARSTRNQRNMRG